MIDLELAIHTFDDGPEAWCLQMPFENGTAPIPVEDVALFAALLDDDVDFYDQVRELARTYLSRGYAGGVEA